MFMEKEKELMEKFFKTMLEFFPKTEEAYQNSIMKHGERLDTIVIEDIFMPEVVALLKRDEDSETLVKVFEYFEEVSNCDDSYLLNIFSITVLEILGNDKRVLEKAKKYMGAKTIQLQEEADWNLGR